MRQRGAGACLNVFCNVQGLRLVQCRVCGYRSDQLDTLQVRPCKLAVAIHGDTTVELTRPATSATTSVELDDRNQKHVFYISRLVSLSVDRADSAPRAV